MLSYLYVRADVVFWTSAVRKLSIRESIYIGEVPVGLKPFGVVPNHDETELFDARPRLDFRLRWGWKVIWPWWFTENTVWCKESRRIDRALTFGCGIRDRCAFPRMAVKLPSVERTFYAIASDLATYAQVGSQVRTIRVQHVHHPFRVSEDNEVFSCEA